MATPHDIVTTRIWLARALERVAGWREAKAEQYPADLRNRRSAEALRAAAKYVLENGDIRQGRVSPNIERMADLVAAASATDPPVILTTGNAFFPGNEGQRAAARYYFDDPAEPPDSTTHEELIHDLYQASLRDLREFGVPDGSPLGQLLKSKEPPLLDSETAILKQIRDTLNGRADLRIARIRQYLDLRDALIHLEHTAGEEADLVGNLPQALQPTRIPQKRKAVGIALKALVVLDGPMIDSAKSLVETAPRRHTEIASGVVSALDEIDRALDDERVALDEAA